MIHAEFCIYMYVLDWRTTRGGREEARKVTMDLAQLPPIFLPAAVGQIKDVVLGGVALEHEQREKFNQIQ